jgi:peptidoglycan/xylan/chitin deacetylase (PgdA/CDA1 family)
MIEVAAPILRDCGVPATFFLPTSFLESPRLPWWDKVACIIKQSRVRRLELPRRPADDGGDGARRLFACITALTGPKSPCFFRDAIVYLLG